MGQVVLTGNIACCSQKINTIFQCKSFHIHVECAGFVVRVASLINMALNILVALSLFFHSAEEDYYQIRRIFMRQGYTPTSAGNQDFCKGNIILILLSQLIQINYFSRSYGGFKISACLYSQLIVKNSPLKIQQDLLDGRRILMPISRDINCNKRINTAICYIWSIAL